MPPLISNSFKNVKYLMQAMRNLAVRQAVTALLLVGGVFGSSGLIAQDVPPTVPAVAASTPPGSTARPQADDTPLSHNDQPIDYEGSAAHDPVARLAERLQTRPDLLESVGQQGYLRSLLRALDVPVESQLLVYSKSSAQVRLISPKSPRAIYFNDDVYVAWIPETKALEISAVDPHKGGMFYRLEQSSNPPRFERESSCLLCHISTSTQRVPGHMVRSFITNTDGQMLHGWSRMTHETPHAQRFGGWYLTGDVGSQLHLGNLVGAGQEQQRRADPDFRNNLPQLTSLVDLSSYPHPHSDAVAQQVLIHQAHGHNLITRLNYEARLKQPLSALEPLVRYLVFADEAPWPAPMTGSTRYADWFQKQWAPDSEDRSLRQLNLQTRLFEYRLSFLIETRSFMALPDPERKAVLQRIGQILRGADPQLQHHTEQERTALRGLLEELHPEWSTDLGF